LNRKDTIRFLLLERKYMDAPSDLLPDFSEYLNNAEFPKFSCPRCGKEHHKTFGWLASNSSFVCDNCRETVTFNSEHLQASLQTFGDSLAFFWQTRDYSLVDYNPPVMIATTSEPLETPVIDISQIL
jgi:hypothetical protein